MNEVKRPMGLRDCARVCSYTRNTPALTQAGGRGGADRTIAPVSLRRTAWRYGGLCFWDKAMATVWRRDACARRVSAQGRWDLGLDIINTHTPHASSCQCQSGSSIAKCTLAYDRCGYYTVLSSPRDSERLRSLNRVAQWTPATAALDANAHCCSRASLETLESCDDPHSIQCSSNRRGCGEESRV